MSTPSRPRSGSASPFLRRLAGLPTNDEARPPLAGYKIAYPMVSADGCSVGFNGVALGRSQVYGAVADAVCVQSPRHRCPSSWCDCGFYCFHDAESARALACDPQYAQSVVLEIQASGRYIHYELGLRYARQTIDAVRVGHCSCGRGAAALADAGRGIVGWRRLVPVCGLCAGMRPVLSLPAFARLLDGPPVTPDPGLSDSVLPLADGAVRAAAGGPEALDALDETAMVPLLSAEVSLLQARLDELQRHLERLTHRDR